MFTQMLQTFRCNVSALKTAEHAMSFFDGCIEAKMRRLQVFVPPAIASVRIICTFTRLDRTDIRFKVLNDVPPDMMLA